MELLPVRGIELWWLVWEVLEKGGGELELVLVNGGPVLELGLAIAQRTRGEGEEGQQWQGDREGRQGRAAAERRGGTAATRATHVVRRCRGQFGLGDPGKISGRYTRRERRERRKFQEI